MISKTDDMPKKSNNINSKIEKVKLSKIRREKINAKDKDNNR